MKYQLMVCTRCHLTSEQIPPISEYAEISAKATIKVDSRDPLVMLIIPHRPECRELTWTTAVID